MGIVPSLSGLAQVSCSTTYPTLLHSCLLSPPPSVMVVSSGTGDEFRRTLAAHGGVDLPTELACRFISEYRLELSRRCTVEGPLPPEHAGTHLQPTADRIANDHGKGRM